MSEPRKTAIVTGASQGIGAGIVKGFVERGFNVVANSRKMTQSTEVAASGQIALVDGDIGEPATAAKIVETALSRFKSIDVLVNNAGIFSPSRSPTTRPRTSSRSSRRTSGVSCTSPNFDQANVGAENGWEHCHDHGGSCSQPDPGCHGGGADDHQRRS